MKVLLYIEPHPIRDSYSHFDDIARRFLPQLVTRGDLDFRMFANAKTFEKLGADLLKPYDKRLIRSTAEEEAVLEQHMLEWQKDGTNLWLDLMRGHGEVSDEYLKILHRIWQIFPFDVIVHWGENGAITRFLDDHPVTRIAMERGCTRAPFLESSIMDPYGTNGSAIVPRLAAEDLREIVGGDTMSSHDAIMAYSQSLETLPYEYQFSMISSKQLGQSIKGQRLVFLPLQLYDDANLLRFSPYRTLTDVVLDVVPRLAARGYKVLIKPHPASRHRPSATMANSLAHAALREWLDHVVWCDQQDHNHSNTQLICLADFVVTVNSSVGFEALYFDKPVVVLGDAVYKPKNLFPTLEQMLDGDFDNDAYQENIGYLRRFFLGGYLHHDNIRSDAAQFGERLSLIHGLQRKYLGDPSAFAREYWRAVSPASLARNFLSCFAGNSTPDSGVFGRPQIPKQEESAAPVVTVDVDATLEPYLIHAMRLLAASKAREPEAFDRWLDALLDGEEGATRFLKIAEFLDPEYYLDTYADIRVQNIDPVEHFTAWGHAEGRAPNARIPSVSPGATSEIVKKTVREILQGNAIADFPLTLAEEANRRRQIGEIRSALSTRNNRIAVVAHLYYLDLVPELLEKARAIPEAFDLIVTLPDWGARRIRETVREAFPDAIFYEAANRGRDIGPFVDVLPLIIGKNYDAVLKIQTKRGYYVAGRFVAELGDLWRQETFDALMGSPARVSAIVDAFRADAALTMVGPTPYFLSLEEYPYHDLGCLARLLLGQSAGKGFFAGTMFWFRPDSLRALADILSITSFAPETGANVGAIAHLVERLLGHAATSNGQVRGAPVDAGSGLDVALKVSTVRIHDHLLRALETQKQSVMAVKGALAW